MGRYEGKPGREMKFSHRCLEDDIQGWKIRHHPIAGWYWVAYDPSGPTGETMGDYEMQAYVINNADTPLMKWEKEIYNGL